MIAQIATLAAQTAVEEIQEGKKMYLPGTEVT